jgi:hypothetical protein
MLVEHPVIRGAAPQGDSVLGKNPTSRSPGIRFERRSIRMSGIFTAECEARFSPRKLVKTPDIRTAPALIGFRGRVRRGQRIELPWAAPRYYYQNCARFTSPLPVRLRREGVRGIGGQQIRTDGEGQQLAPAILLIRDAGRSNYSGAPHNVI